MEERQLIVGEYIDSYLPALDGVITAVRNYAYWLNRNHCEAYIASAAAPKDYEEADDVPVVRYKALPLKKRPPYRFGMPTLDRDFVKTEHLLAPDLVHLHTPFTAGLEGLRLAKTRKIPAIGSFHSKYYDDALQVTRSRFLAQTTVELIASFYERCDYVWAVNEGAAETLRQYGYKGALTIMPNGSDFIYPADEETARREIDERFHLNPDEPLLLFVGQHILQKNLPMILDAFALLKKENLPVQLMTVGAGYAADQLKQQAEKLGIADFVTFAGTVSDRALLAKIYLRAALFVFPSVYDNAPLVVREAAMAACPSVLVAGSSAAEDFKHGYNVFLCQNNAQSLADTIKDALSNEERRRSVGLCAQKTIARSWESVIATVYEKYLEILDEYKGKTRGRSRK